MRKGYVKVYDFPILDDRSWLETLLDDHNIPYETEIGSHWAGSIQHPKFIQHRDICVPESCRSLAEALIAQYDTGPFIWDDDAMFPGHMEGILPTVRCPSCGREYEIDYPKCPFCGIPSPSYS